MEDITKHINDDIITLTCGSGDHQITIGRLRHSGDVVVRISLIKDKSFINRVIRGIQYIFNVAGKHPDYDDFILNNAHSNRLLEIITKLSADTHRVYHAVRELELSGYFDGDEMNTLMAKQVIELITVFSLHGHNEYTASHICNLFDKLSKFNILNPLDILNDKEWNLLKEKDGYVWYQNKRDSSIFKDDKGVWDIDAYTKEIKFSRYFSSNEIVPINGGCSIGAPVFETKDGIATGRGFKTVYFKNIVENKGITPREKIYLPVTQIEVQKDDWLMFVAHNSKELKELKEYYRVNWFKVPTLKGQPIISLDSNHGY